MLWPMPFRRSRLFRAIAPIVAGVALTWAGLGGTGRAETPRTPDFHATARLAGFEHPIEIRQSGGRRRVDLATDAVVQSYIADSKKGVLIALTAAGRRRLALVFPLAQADVATPLPTELAELDTDEDMTRIGGSQVAGRPCTLYRYTGAQGRKGVVCATADGIVLQLTPDGRSGPLFEVETLDLAPQDPRWFTPPPEYQVAVLPGLGGATHPQP